MYIGLYETPLLERLQSYVFCASCKWGLKTWLILDGYRYGSLWAAAFMKHSCIARWSFWGHFAPPYQEDASRATQMFMGGISGFWAPKAWDSHEPFVGWLFSRLHGGGWQGRGPSIICQRWARLSLILLDYEEQLILFRRIPKLLKTIFGFWWPSLEDFGEATCLIH